MNQELLKVMMVGAIGGYASCKFFMWTYENPRLVKRILWGVNGKK